MKELNDFFASLGQKTLAELKNALAIEISLFSWENTVVLRIIMTKII